MRVSFSQGMLSMIWIRHPKLTSAVDPQKKGHSFKWFAKSHSKRPVVWLLLARAGYHVLTVFLSELCLFLTCLAVLAKWVGVCFWMWSSGPLLISGETPRCLSYLTLRYKQKMPYFCIVCRISSVRQDWLQVPGLTHTSFLSLEKLPSLRFRIYP